MIRLPHLALCLFAVLQIQGFATSGEIKESFDSATAASGTTGVWNVSTGSLHVPLVVDRSGGSVVNQEDEAVSIGTGADGKFDATTAVSFDVNSGGIPGTITLDTSRIYQFTTFTLTAGTTLFGTGSAPLRIRVQGNAEIAGTVDLRGGNGGDSFAVAAPLENGGTACCGGGAGGSGPNGSQTFSTDGVCPAVGTLGGQPGTLSAVAGTDAGAGGGGGNRYAGSVGAFNVPASGAAGPAYGDETLVTLLGGAGGGGGAGNSNLGTGGPGGGGGGGVLSLQAGGSVLLTGTGQILTTGGNGGAVTVGAHKAGGGGGGAGGSVLIYAAGNGTNNGTIDSTGGLGGTASVVGGDGGGGVNRFAFLAGEFTGTGSENPPPSLLPKPRTVYTRTAVTFISPNYDSGSSNPHYTEIVKDEIKHTGDTITYEIAGSTDNFVADDTGYLPESQLNKLDSKRYFRFKVRMQSATTSTTPEVRQLRILFKNLFEFSLVGCANTERPRSGNTTYWGWLILAGLLGALSLGWRRCSPQKR